ncbi:hypothetical protein INT47_008038 [Mucor saturninus]|uniref:Uncharacterized protein n=1 Tax=Mucor saturninus TaxID=64648 RepID=A0A8H7R9Q8_9FUNG|nr:hypothetical protein INT47_008038 [Mucor saturninus]
MTLLFVGRLPRYFNERDLEELFDGCGNYGRCKVRSGSRFGYGFIEFDKYDDALYAIRQKTGFYIEGMRIVVELAKSTREDNKCYSCGEAGHYSNRCPSRYISLLSFISIKNTVYSTKVKKGVGGRVLSET